MSRSFVSNEYCVLVGLAIVVGGVLTMVSCSESPRPTGRRSSGPSAAARQDDSAELIETVAKTLNQLPDEVVVDLLPPEPILDDSKSADGQPVLATLDLNPQDLEGGYVYLSVPAGNGNFSGLRVQAGDIVRYFVKYDIESEEHGGGGQVGFFEMPVRRLDTSNPNNALILEVPLTAAVPEPHRIEIWRFSDRRVREIRLRLEKYIRRRDPAIAWEPSPDESALVQLVDRVNQWYRNLGKDRVAWKAPTLTDSLPEQLRKSQTIAAIISPDSLRSGQFNLAEARSMQEAVWLRDISTWAKGDAYEKVAIAKALFDWTIRNIQLDDPLVPGIIHQPWQALMYGHGTAADRAWVFIELCRQQQIDAVILAFGEAGETAAKKWLVAAVSDDTLSLFDPLLGLAIPGEEPDTVATLAEVIANPEVLRKLDLEEEQPYPLVADDLKTIRAQGVATPLQLSRRSALLQAVLQGEDFVVLSADLERVEKSLESQKALAAVELWPYPYEARLAEETMKRPQREAAAQRFLVFSQSPRLWKARVLHFQGTKPVPVAQQNDPLAQPRRGHRDATQLYQSSEIRPPENLLARMAPLERAFLATAKADASYWLGLLSYDLGKFQVADDWFRTRTLKAYPNGPWANGARYNLARTLIELGKNDEAIAILEVDKSPQRNGNRVLAKQLSELAHPERGNSNANTTEADSPVAGDSGGDSPDADDTEEFADE